ncbi:alpha/beta fold hydrolase [Streptomyces sp. NPDC059786]|uniref:alpha/beta fold hydrolase n=1 Tax=Streptomyces sp. NPDC059786 TaxID=3346946 RepID=UPI00365C6E46
MPSATAPAWAPPAWNPPESTREEVVRLNWRGLRYTCRVVTSEQAPATEPLLLLGGALQDMYAWPRLERRLSGHTTLILTDLPGTGTADDLPAEQGFDVLADAALHIAERLGHDRVNLLGASYGAAIAYRAALHRPDRVARLVLVGATHGMNPRVRSICEDIRGLGAACDHADSPGRDLAADRAVAALVNHARQDLVTQSGAVARLLRRQFVRITPYEARRNAVCYDRLLGMAPIPRAVIDSVPALVFTGEHDHASTPAENRAVAATIRDAAFVLVRDADHMVHLEREAEYADLVLRFLTDLPLEELPYCTPPEHPDRR